MLNLIKDILRPVYHNFLSMIYYSFRIFPIQKNKVVITNYYGKGFGDNGKAIALELHRRVSNIDIVWLVNQTDNTFPIWIRQVKYGSIKSVYELVTAKFWIDNARKRKYVRKREQQYYIQTWHGSIALKQIEKDAEDKLPKDYLDSAKNDSKMANLLLSNSKWCTEMYKRAFWYDGEILECGSPRCDQLYKKDNTFNPVHNYYGISSNVKLLLYAPTFRNVLRDSYNIDFYRLHDALTKKFKEDVKIIVRLHPNVEYSDYSIVYNDFILNGTSYPDMYELMKECDMMINDYSSSMFEFALLEKPVWLYATDIVDYIQERGFYFDLRQMPFPLAENNEELLLNVEKYNEVEYKANLRNFMQELDVYEKGTASFLVVERIVKIYNCS